jgi:TonB family protein
VIVVEFVIFVVSSGLFCSERFRHHLWAVVIAGAVATGSSLLFMYDFAEKLSAHATAPVRIVTQTVRVPVPVVQHVSQPPMLSRQRDCRDRYPFFARLFGREGVSELAFTVRADGSVGDLKVAKSSGYDSLDDAAKACVRHWRYRPAIKDNVLVDAPMRVSVVWSLSAPAAAPVAGGEGADGNAGVRADEGAKAPHAGADPN